MAEVIIVGSDNELCLTRLLSEKALKSPRATVRVGMERWVSQMAKATGT